MDVAGIRRASIGLAVATTLMFATPVGAVATSTKVDPLSFLPEPAATRVDRALDDAARLRASLTGRSFAAAFGALLGVPNLRAPRAARHVDPVVGLDDAVHRVRRLLGTPRVAQVDRAFRSIARMVSRARSQVRLPRTPWLKRASSRRARAVMILAAALDRHLPSLAAGAGAPARARAAGCDRLDQLPWVCVGSEADNTYTQDAALLIDLGGNDLYRNSAGGAPFLPPDASAYVPVSVNVDLGGNDRYEPAPDLVAGVASHSGAGWGFFGAIGIAVDSGGNDRYAMVADGSTPSTATGQGAGLGGTGVLFDLGGADDYVVTGMGFALAQGAADFCAGSTGTTPPLEGAGCPVGAIVDRASGDDSYRITSPLSMRGEGSTIRGQAYANLGRGVIFDDGGSDAFVIRESASNEPRRPEDAGAAPAFSSIQGQGFATFGANAAILEGSGPTLYSVEMTGSGRSGHRAWVQGVASGHGTSAIIDDAGGNDSYSARGTLIDHRTITVDDGCACDRAEAQADGFPIGIIYEIDIRAQGAPLTNGVAVVNDRSGNDNYEVTGRHEFQVDLRDQLSSPAAPPKLTVSGYASPRVRAQGMGYDFAVGLISDLAGNDAYLLRAENETRAAALSERATGDPVVTATSRDRTNVMGQGASPHGFTGAGAIIDLEGTGDRFEAVATNPVTTSPDPDGAFQTGGDWPSFHGAFGGILVALGDSPRIVSRPSRGICRAAPGSRGFGTWFDCVVSGDDPDHQQGATIPLFMHDSLGFAPRATGTKPTIEFLSPTPSVAAKASRVTVAARLLDPSGVPIVGVPLRFDLQFGCSLLCSADATGMYWNNRWEGGGDDRRAWGRDRATADRRRSSRFQRDCVPFHGDLRRSSRGRAHAATRRASADDQRNVTRRAAATRGALFTVASTSRRRRRLRVEKK